MLEVGKLVKSTRQEHGITQKQLALASGTGVRFIIDLEDGKTTCQAEKVFRVLGALGIKAELTPPELRGSE